MLAARSRDPEREKKWIYDSYYSCCGRRAKRAGCGREGSRNICFETKHRSRGGRGRGSGRFETKHRSRGGRFILAVASLVLIDADSASPSASFSEELGAGLGATACASAVTALPSTSSLPLYSSKPPKQYIDTLDAPKDARARSNQ
jgi:hypothetical protein